MIKNCDSSSAQKVIFERGILAELIKDGKIDLVHHLEKMINGSYQLGTAMNKAMEREKFPFDPET